MFNQMKCNNLIAPIYSKESLNTVINKIRTLTSNKQLFSIILCCLNKINIIKHFAHICIHIIVYLYIYMLALAGNIFFLQKSIFCKIPRPMPSFFW